MKKLFLALVLVTSFAFSQTNIDRVVGASTYVIDSLTTATDTASYLFTAPHSYHTLMTRTISGADTLQVYVLSASGLSWTRISAIGKTDGSTVTEIVVSTTPKEYILFDSVRQKIRFISTSNDGSITIIEPSTKR